MTWEEIYNLPEKKRLNSLFGGRKWRPRHPVERHAHKIVFINIRNGKLKRQPCEVCGKLKVEAHHEDYSRPLEINWLCKKHHAERDKERRNKLKTAK